jgi:hypothetical protein
MNLRLVSSSNIPYVEGLVVIDQGIRAEGSDLILDASLPAPLAQYRPTSSTSSSRLAPALAKMAKKTQDEKLV